MGIKQFTNDAAKRIIAAAKVVEAQIVGQSPKFAHGAGSPDEPWYFGKLKSTLSPGGSAEMDVYKWDSSAWVDAEWDLTVYAPPLLTTGSITGGKWVRVELHIQAGRWYVVNAEC